jgi:uncharacterized membrane protein YdbT with pleckstrin-like domain
MCGGPSQAEKKAAAEQRVEAEGLKQEAARDTAEAKREDIGDALSARVQRQGKRGGTGRRSLFSSAQGGAGYLNRFD